MGTELSRRSRRAPGASWSSELGAALALAGVTALAYANALTSAFVYDDELFVARDQRFDLDTLVRLFHEHATAAANVAVPVYRPLAMATIALDSSRYGEDATGYHATSVALHVAATLAVYALVRSLLRARDAPDDRRRTMLPALLAAGLFGLHPIHAEAVDSIFNRSELLATGFVTAGLAALVRWVDTRPRLAWLIAACTYLLALLCKESAATFPALAAVLLVTVVFRGDARARLRRLAPGLALIAPAATYLRLASSALADRGADISRADVVDPRIADGAAGRVALFVTTLRDHLRMVVWPHPLRASYADYTASGVPGALAIHAALLGAAFAVRRRAPWLTAGIGFFYVAILPSSRLVTDASIATPLAERYVYLPSVALAIVVAFVVASLVRRFGPARVVLAAIAPAICLAWLTARRNEAWRDSEALWSADVAVAPTNGDAWMKLTTHLLRQRRFDRVIELCAQNLQRAPGHAQLHNNCASAAKALGQWDLAEPLFRRSIDLGGGAVVHANLARMYARLDRAVEARAEFSAAVEAEPDPAMKHVRRGEMLFAIDHPTRDAEARAELEAALARDPRLKVAREWLARIDAAEGR